MKTNIEKCHELAKKLGWKRKKLAYSNRFCVKKGRKSIYYYGGGFWEYFINYGYGDCFCCKDLYNLIIMES